MLDDARPTEKTLQYGVGIHPCRGGHRGGLIFQICRIALTAATRVAAARTTGSSWDEPSVEPQTSSLVKEQQTRLMRQRQLAAGSFDEFSRRTRASQPSLTAADLSRFDERSVGYSITAETANRKLRQVSSNLPLSFPSPAPPVTFFLKGSLSGWVGRERLVWDQTCFSFGSVSVSFSPRLTYRHRGMGEYTEDFRPVKGGPTKFLPLVSRPERDTSITHFSRLGS